MRRTLAILAIVALLVFAVGGTVAVADTSPQQNDSADTNQPADGCHCPCHEHDNHDHGHTRGGHRHPEHDYDNCGHNVHRDHHGGRSR
ncbi:hypothetical protein [Halosegnis sp.]|uniref:hypothetical protein n=1 Tax=Halosegnis sp. TaxID=2864959 RepID=UPI0035D4AA4C